jgi:hypothetical protein
VQGFDSQAILGYNGPGPFKIMNNYLEAAGENIMFGGADPVIPGLVPSDIQIVRNHLFKPIRWDPAHASYAGTLWTLKNLVELKNAQRVAIEGNVLENMFGERGAALLLTPRNQENTAPWSVVQDVTFRNNVIKNVAIGCKIQGSDDGFASQQTKRIRVSNNVWLQIARSLCYLIGPVDDLVIDRNTAMPVGDATYHVEGMPPFRRFHLRDNILGFGTYGLRFSRQGASAQRWFPDSVVAGNVLVRVEQLRGPGETGYRQEQATSFGGYRSFASRRDAGLREDGRLTASSPLKGIAAEGQDVGVNFAELYAVLGPALAGTVRLGGQ